MTFTRDFTVSALEILQQNFTTSLKLIFFAIDRFLTNIYELLSCLIFTISLANISFLQIITLLKKKISVLKANFISFSDRDERIDGARQVR